MNGRERVLAVLNGQKADHPPVFSANQTATYEQMKKMGAFWPDAHEKARDMANLASGAYRILGFDAVRVPFCQTFEAEALGAKLKHAGDKGVPSVNGHPYTLGDEPSVPENFLSRGRIPELIAAVRLLKEEVGNQVAVIGGIVGPFSLATSLLGVTAMLRTSFKKPDSVVPYLEVAEQAGTLLGKALIEAGADIICVEDMMTSLNIISPPIFRGLASPYQLRQLSQLTEVPTILHICGKLNPLIEEVAKAKPTAISVEEVVNVPAAREAIKHLGRHLFIGGVNAAQTLFSGEPGDVKREVQAALESGYDVIAPSCSIPPGSPTENLLAMVEAVQAHGR